MTIRFFKYIICLVAFFASTFPSTSEAQERERRVGVTVSAFFNTDAEMANAISEAVGRALGKTLIVQTVAGTQAQSKLPEAARSETCIGDTDCLMGAGRSLEVDELLMLIVVGGGDEIKIEATWASMDTGETALRPAIVVPIALEEMESILASQATTLIPGVALRKDAASVETSGVKTGGGNSGEGTTTLSGNDFATPSKGSSGGLSPLGKGLFIGGAAVVTGWIGYGAYRWNECGALGAFGSACDEGVKDHFKRDLVIDVVGGVGTAALSAALIMYFSSDDDEHSPSSSARKTLIPTLDSQSLGFALGGQF